MKALYQKAFGIYISRIFIHAYLPYYAIASHHQPIAIHFCVDGEGTVLGIRRGPVPILELLKYKICICIYAANRQPIVVLFWVNREGAVLQHLARAMSQSLSSTQNLYDLWVVRRCNWWSDRYQASILLFSNVLSTHFWDYFPQTVNYTKKSCVHVSQFSYASLCHVLVLYSTDTNLLKELKCEVYSYILHFNIL